MYPRIKLARNLLKNDGCIFIAIDHYELNNLINICNEIFGEANKIGIVAVLHNPEGRQNAKFLTYTHEYFLIYCKNIDNFNFNKVVLQENNKNPTDIEILYPFKDDIGRYRHDNFVRLAGGDASLRKNKPSCWYPIYVSDDLKHISTEKIKGYNEIFPITGKGQERTWKLVKESTNQKINNNQLKAIKENNKIQIVERYGVDKGSPITSLWINPKYNSKKYGTSIILDLFDKKIFDFPKSLNLINDILSLADDKNDIILDFFSGSATTAQAIMMRNLNDDGNRKFIMVQLPEATDEKSEAYKAGYENICEIGRERIRKAGDKILEESDNKDLDIGFKVFKLDSSNLEKWNPDYDNLQQSLFTDNIKEDRTKEDLIYEIMLKSGIDLTYPIEKINNFYIIGHGALVINLEDNITKEIADEIIKLKEKYNIIRVVFKDSGFKSDSDKTNIKETLKINNIEEFITI